MLELLRPARQLGDASDRPGNRYTRQGACRLGLSTSVLLPNSGSRVAGRGLSCCEPTRQYGGSAIAGLIVALRSDRVFGARGLTCRMVVESEPTGRVRRLLVEQEARPGACGRESVVGVVEPATLQREASAANAARKSLSQPLQVGDLLF